MSEGVGRFGGWISSMGKINLGVLEWEIVSLVGLFGDGIKIRQTHPGKDMFDVPEWGFESVGNFWGL